MLTPKVLILRTAGTNCDYETRYAFEKAGAKVDVVHINILLASKKLLKDYQILTLPGGFTYGDDVSAGKILANQIKYNLEEDITTFINEKKLILGICNGFQTLTKAGLLPSVNKNHQEATLTFNDSNKFEDRWVYLKVCSNKSVFIKDTDIPTLYLPIAHGEGKFITKDKTVLNEITTNHQVVFKYVNERGEEAGYPWNPAGAIQNIAGICDPTGQILGMMPHPERHVEPAQHPRWTRNGPKEWGDGFFIFKNAVQYVKTSF
ncbi:MAG: phosphoribosylformylglycinamidine synthase I [Candidatus Brocadia sp. AMX2]|uniref:Phosphoribosylformylglycinamidine synthase subunit PurQ n=1 Tax=Candidatus Brocadia sinica JPN1 TaxID=1197129 RepID=A0ABQ0JZS4_9BACT|nr:MULTISPECIES: phosphoribosylformylglycinamidine synthase I [Brocadia]KXK25343.1 MAG: phosphoribosylformylglycinamidine synthase I [Candidatus Brocadia sinica]MBC6932445.1 phosphoribosylformylglycinamidine synthase I [Candidatus Brocadia sp.]MBL1170795.1 phosphoribosylformylglycinamidine synthase I [Candidatus Brocadia sp. AMX1]NOG42095.1 phosphoribosylformylglycinamidine synthase I [Planctomycetota bacterium]GJQ47578.1 MAG: phosphoribosylformylglycinamidine synthase [Candidatus Jettenia cae